MKIAFICNGPFYENFRNFNYYQRIYFFSEWASITLFVSKEAVISREVENKVTVKRSSLGSKKGFFLFLLISIFCLKKFELIITEPSTFTIFGFLSKLFYGKKWVIDIWDIPFRDLALTNWSILKRKLQVFCFRPIFQTADLHFVSIIPNFQLKEFNLPEKNMHCFINAIYLKEFEKLPLVEPFEKFTILIQRSQFYLGFGLDLMLSAFQIVLEKIDANLLVVGKIMPEVQQYIDNFFLKGNIITTGFVPHEEFKRLALKSHLCVIPYPKIVDLQQIHPIKAIEFMALGKAIVATKLEGLERLIGDAGVLVDPVTPENVANAILNLHDNPEKIKVLAQKARERSSLFDAQKKNQLIFKEIHELLTPQ